MTPSQRLLFMDLLRPKKQNALHLYLTYRFKYRLDHVDP